MLERKKLKRWYLEIPCKLINSSSSKQPIEIAERLIPLEPDASYTLTTNVPVYYNRLAINVKKGIADETR